MASTPTKRPRDGQVLATVNHAYNALVSATCAPAGRAHLPLAGRWHALDRLILDLHRTTEISAAALVLTSLERGRW